MPKSKSPHIPTRLTKNNAKLCLRPCALASNLIVHQITFTNGSGLDRVIVHLAAELEEEEFGSPVATFEELGNALNGVVDSAMARLAFEPARFVREWLIGRAGKTASPCQTLPVSWFRSPLHCVGGPK